MTDRELLEAAAKAAGLYIDFDNEIQGAYRADGDWWCGWWNPLQDDGDALRLAVRLRMRVCCPTTDTDCALASNGDITAYSEDDLDASPMADLYAATRRAIVRAAAEIGKGMA